MFFNFSFRVSSIARFRLLGFRLALMFSITLPNPLSNSLSIPAFVALMLLKGVIGEMSAEMELDEICLLPLGSGGGGVVHGGPKSCMGALVTSAVQNVLMSIIGSIITGVWHFVYRAK